MEREDRGFRQIGSLMPMIAVSPQNSGSNRSERPRDSATTGMPSPARTVAKPTGRPHGETGAVATLTTLPSLLAAGNPAETDRALEALWTRQLGSSPVAMVRPVYDQPGGYDEVMEGFQRASRFDGELVAVLEDACLPAHPDMVTKELARLKAGTVGRAMDGIDMEAWLIVVGDELEEFPADVIRGACRKWLRREKWTPSVAELVDECQRLGRRRKLLRIAASGIQRNGAGEG